MEQTESPEINPHIYSQLIFDKGGKNIQWKNVSSASGVGKVVPSHVMKLEHTLIPYTEIN